MDSQIQDLLAQVATLRQEVETLQREKTELALMMEMSTEHADNVTNELQALTERLEKRATQLEASSQVGQLVTAFLSLDGLLPEVVEGIQAKFGYYFVGIFLLGEQDVLTLQAGHRQGSRRQLEMGLAIPLNSPRSIVLAACQAGRYYLAADTRTDPQYLAWQDMPGTRSELALPLRIGPKILGVLDIQSEHPAAFETEDIRVLQTLADQVAIAIRNAQLYAEVVRFNEQLEHLVQQRTAELDKAYRVLERMDKTKTDFITVAAHELRTPLTLIKGYAQLLGPMIQDDPQIQSLVEGILAGQGRLHEVVNSLLDVTKIGSHALALHKEPTVLAEIVSNLHSAFEATLQERQLTLSTACLETLPVVMADPDMMFKLLNHLLINAIKYTPDGGSITIEASLIPSNAGAGLGEHVQLVVSDTGIGIDPEHHELIFEKFYQAESARLHSSGKTKFKGGGPGLGLAIAKGIVDAHGGRIWVESSGRDEVSCPGSAFHVLLPVGNH
ncbi:MAG: GAF domain-containing protein [Thermoflexales bacterium]|nr:GAF domain-containing protein [Thermoflexales bacterium]